MKQAEVYQAVTDRIIKQIEAGTPPWRKPWITTGGGLPQNAASGRSYSGINVWLLLLAAEAKGYDGNLWGTFNQWKKLGGHVNRGERGTKIVFWSVVKETVADQQTGKEDEQKRIFCRQFTVFNLGQTAGEALDRFRRPTLPPKGFNDHEAVEQVIAATDADIRHGGNAAYYNSESDYIQLPVKVAFESEAEYYSASLHEIAHWSGHENRLNRLDKLARFGDQSYAMEELVAEMSSAFLCSTLGVENSAAEKQSASYLANWLGVLKADSRAIFTASTAAAAAADYVLSFSQGVESEETEEDAVAA